MAEKTQTSLEPHPVRILSICGGGIRGLIAAQTLGFIEEYTGKRIHELFHLVAGTSIGGVMACALTKQQPMAAVDVSQLLVDCGPHIFRAGAMRPLRTGWGTWHPRYDGTGLHNFLAEHFGEQLFETAVTPTLVPAYNLQDRRPNLMRSWCPEAPPETLINVCRATSAAPTYFPPHKAYGDWHIDGGVVANNPALTAVIEACKLYGVHTRHCHVVSIGTGLCTAKLNTQRAQTWGKLGWAAPLIDVMLDGVPDLVDQQLRDLLPDQNYVSIDPIIDPEHAALDNHDLQNLSALIAIGHKALDSQKDALVALLNRM